MSIDVEIISIGNELLIGKIENTNAQWLSKQITSLGATVRRVTVIQDIIDEIAKCINEVSARRPLFIITTGGLGPTFDDKTFQGIAKALNQKLVINPEAYEMVKQKCLEYSKKIGVVDDCAMTPARLKMSIFPEKTEPIINPVGTAPALQTQILQSQLFALPGIPAEMKAIFNQAIVPLIKSATGMTVFHECSIFSDCIVESKLAPLIDEVMAEYQDVYIKSHPLGSSKEELHLTMIQRQEFANIIKEASEQLKALIVANGGIILAKEDA